MFIQFYYLQWARIFDTLLKFFFHESFILLFGYSTSVACWNSYLNCEMHWNRTRAKAPVPFGLFWKEGLCNALGISGNARLGSRNLEYFVFVLLPCCLFEYFHLFPSLHLSLGTASLQGAPYVPDNNDGSPMSPLTCKRLANVNQSKHALYSRDWFARGANSNTLNVF